MSARRMLLRGGLLGAAGLGATALLAGCGPSGPVPVSYDGADPSGIQSATIQIEGQGTFVDVGYIEPTEAGWSGSGFFIDPSGIAVTNNHVVAGAGSLQVWIGGERATEYSASVIGASECYDLAVIQVSTVDPVPFFGWFEGDIVVGQDAISLGFPLGDPAFTLTKGVVSKADIPFDSEWASVPHVIEHDARIRGGNSGGPLVSSVGTVLGVNYAGWSEEDYNWAIHRDDAMAVVERLAAGEQVLSLGLNAQALVGEDGSAGGVWVSSVTPGGPGDLAGIEAGDIIDRLAGITMGEDGTLAGYCEVLRSHDAEAAISLEVFRPATGETLEGQINGSPLEVTGTSSGGQQLSEFIDVWDDAHAVTVTVPGNWTDIDGAPFDGLGATWESVIAAESLSAFLDTWEGGGVQVAATPSAVSTPADLLASLSEITMGTCTANFEADPYDDGLYRGVWSDFDCGVSEYIVIAANDYDATLTIIVIAQLVTDFERDEGVTRILNSFSAWF